MCSAERGKGVNEMGTPWWKGDRMKRTGIAMESRIVTPSVLVINQRNFSPVNHHLDSGWWFVFYSCRGTSVAKSRRWFVSLVHKHPKGALKGRWLSRLFVCSAVRVNHLQGCQREIAPTFLPAEQMWGKIFPDMFSPLSEPLCWRAIKNFSHGSAGLLTDFCTLWGSEFGGLLAYPYLSSIKPK